MTRAPLLALAALLTSSCGAALMKLPQGPGSGIRPAGDPIAEATSACRQVKSITATAGVSGSINGQRLRASLNLGAAAPDSVRVEALAFGQPIFVFAARGKDSSLLLQQENRALEHGPPDVVLESFTSIPIFPSTLLALLAGCPTKDNPGVPGSPGPDDFPSAYGDDWVSYKGGFYHRSGRNGPWRLVAFVESDYPGAWRTEYRDFVNGLPTNIRLVSESPNSKRFDLRLRLSQVETNETIDQRAFQLQIPPSAQPITLDELRKTGPFGGAAQDR